MKQISSKSNKYIKELSTLNSKRNIVNSGLYLVEGRNLILEALEVGVVVDLLVTDNSMYEEYTEVNRIEVSEEVINKLSTNRSNRGCIAVCKYEPLSVNLKLVNKIIVLENINNPGNLGTIIRTALAFGYDAVVTVGESAFIYNDKVIKSAQGALFKMPIMQLKELNGLEDFKPLRFVLSNQALKLEEVELPEGKFALVFGNEANGISEDLLNNWKGLDIMIDIKHVESLNLAVAAGIAMHKYK